MLIVLYLFLYAQGILLVRNDFAQSQNLITEEPWSVTNSNCEELNCIYFIGSHVSV